MDYLGQLQQMDWTGIVGNAVNDPSTQMETIATAWASGPITGAFVTALYAGMDILNTIGIRAGANEADAITPTQNKVGSILTQVNNQIPTATIPALQAMFVEVQNMGVQWLKFLADPRFTDGRASMQAANTIMPLINGTGCYQRFNLVPGCSHVGPAGGGEDGTLGSIQRQIITLGGNMVPSQLTAYAGSGIPQLTFQSPSFPWIPQAGTLPVISSPSFNPGSYTIDPEATQISPQWLLAIAAVGIFLLRGRSKGAQS